MARENGTRLIAENRRARRDYELLERVEAGLVLSGTEVKSARDFIRVVASTSSQSGEPYWIQFKDGRKIKSADFLEAELVKLER